MYVREHKGIQNIQNRENTIDHQMIRIMHSYCPLGPWFKFLPHVYVNILAFKVVFANAFAEVEMVLNVNYL